jgi:aminoglycoside phosphotransferase (APT) family kinase protein
MSATELALALEEELSLLVSGDIANAGRLTVSGPIVVGRQSAIYRAVAQDGKARFALKVYIGSAGNDDPVVTATRQFAALEKARERLGLRGEAQLAKPLAILKTRGALVIEWIEGRNLLRVMRRGWLGPRDCSLLMEQAGNWLRQLHDAGERSVVRLDAAAMADEARLELARCASRPKVELLCKTLVAAAPFVTASEHQASWAHGDFKSANLMLRKGTVVGIDVDLRERGPVVFDVASFLNDLGVNLRFPGMWRLLPFEDRLEQAFLRAYRAVDTIPVTTLRFVQLCALAGVWATETRLTRLDIHARFASKAFFALARRVSIRLSDLVLHPEKRCAPSETPVLDRRKGSRA